MTGHLNNTAVGWTAIAVGLATAVTPAWVTTTPVGAGFTLGLGAMTVIYGMWSLIAPDPTRDHWALTVVGLVRSEEHTSELQSPDQLVCRLLLVQKKKQPASPTEHTT